MLIDVFNCFRNKCINIYELDPAHFHLGALSAWHACLKETEVKLELLADTNILLMVEKSTRGGIYHAAYRSAEANNKYMKDYDLSAESSQLIHWYVNNLLGRAMSQKMSVDGFKWKKNKCRFPQTFIQYYDDGNDKR